MTGVSFGNVHSYDDLELILSSFKITPPKPKTYRINIAAADGDIDITEALTGGMSGGRLRLSLQCWEITARYTANTARL